MSRLGARFEALAGEGRCALVTFVTAGDPAPEATVGIMRALVEAGADVIELGVPFSDPMADGPVIQKASERALAAGMSVRRVLDAVREFRAGDDATPVVLMGYLNPIETFGYEAFARAAAAAGVDGLITVDLPPEEGGEFLAAVRAHDIDPIFLVAPTTDDARIRRVCADASGFVYYVSLKGVTGSATLDVDGIAAQLDRIRAATTLPVGVGFGIRDAETAARVARVSDAVVVGTAIVARVEALAARPADIPADVGEFVRGLRRAMDAARSAAA